MRNISEIRESVDNTIGDALVVEKEEARCAKCDHNFGELSDLKANMAMRVRDIEELGEHWIVPNLLIDDEVIVREYFCPDCAMRISVDVARPNDKEVADIVSIDH